MRILILGGDGMLGHQCLKSWQDRHEVCVTLRRDLQDYAGYGLFHEANSYCGIDVRSSDRLTEVIADFQPKAVINAVGIVKQRQAAKDAIPSLEINAMLPHRLSVLCKLAGARLIHLSTDCVFAGDKGGYTEDDCPDATDMYGRSKLLGEVHDAHCVTLRTSIIGLELSRKKSLVEWFLSQQGNLNGYSRAIYSGFTTAEMARIIERVLMEHPELSGMWHVSSEPIDKLSLLRLLQGKLGEGRRTLHEDASFVCDRSMNSGRFRQATGYQPLSWDAMLEELADQIRERADGA